MPSAINTNMTSLFETIRTQYPGVPFLALGQTVFWDEPVKASFRRLLDEHLPGARLIAGVHDTDYFAKTSAHVHSESEYIAVVHDDGRTRDLWSAAGELSALFGCESIPTRQLFLKSGVPFDWIAARYPGGKAALLTDKTAAWHWTGIVHTGSKNIIAHDVPALDIQEALLAQLDWGFAASIALMHDESSRNSAMETAATIRGWVEMCLAECTQETKLSDLYVWLLPKIYALLLGNPPSHFEATTSTELFRFNSETCGKPRFAILQAFLDKQTRSAACAAYNTAVTGSGIYDLPSLGAGALPFDVVIPGEGRGTLRVTPVGVYIDFFPVSKKVGPASSATTVAGLAALLEAEFGSSAVLVGKAVILADMIAAEHLVLFHETASGYTHLTEKFNTLLARAGVTLSLYPLIRIAYDTWGSLDAAPPYVTFQLPAHLAQAFGAASITANDFAKGWHAAMQSQRGVLREVAAIRRTRELLKYFEARDSQCWCGQIAELEAAYATLKSLAAQGDVLRERSREHQRDINIWRDERLDLERRMGDDWRAHMQPLREELAGLDPDSPAAIEVQAKIDRQLAIRAHAFGEPLALLRDRIRATRYMVAEFRRQRRVLEASPTAKQARATIDRIIYEAQSARLDLVRNAFLAADGLEHTNVRPTAWWLPMVDPTGAWFAAITERVQGRLEYLDGRGGE